MLSLLKESRRELVEHQFLCGDQQASALSQLEVRVESFAGKGGQVPKMQSTPWAGPVFGT
jgi:hypothetical protein